MRNKDLVTVKAFVEDIRPFMEKAKEYVNTHTKNYPKVYFAKIKDGKYGVTLPGVFNIGHSANNCPIGHNDLVFATAWAMKVDDLLAMGDYTYLEWCRKYGYLRRKDSENWATGAEYIRQDVSKAGKEYMLYIPETGNGYKRVYATKDTPNFDSLKKAIFKRDQILYNMVISGRDKVGVLPIGRVSKYKRILVSGYFKSLWLYSNNVDDKKEKYRRYETNVSRIASTFANAITFCEDEKLKSIFSYYYKIFTRELPMGDFQYIGEKERTLKEYFKAIGLWDTTIAAICSMARNEKNHTANIVSALVAKRA